MESSSLNAAALLAVMHELHRRAMEEGDDDDTTETKKAKIEPALYELYQAVDNKKSDEAVQLIGKMVMVGQGQNTDEIKVLSGCYYTGDDTPALHLTPLMHAIHQRLPAVIDALLRAGVDVNVRLLEGPFSTALSAALRSDDLLTTFQLLGRGAQPGLINRDGQTLLHMAAARGAVPFLARYLRVDPHLLEMEDKDGETALMTACREKEYVSVVWCACWHTAPRPRHA